jgi:hypothetical protein
MPLAPTSIFTPPTAGATTTAPASLFDKAPTGAINLVISAVTTSGVNGTLHYAGTNAGKPVWSRDGTQTTSTTNPIMSHDGTSWKLALGATYSATKVSPAADPAALTVWTLSVGAGSPIVAKGDVDAPDIVKASYTSPTVLAPATVFIP